MGYRAIWGKINATEEGLGKPLLVRNTGGAAGGGSQLTPLAESLLKEFRKIHEHVNNETDDFFDNIFQSKLSKKIK